MDCVGAGNSLYAIDAELEYLISRNELHLGFMASILIESSGNGIHSGEKILFISLFHESVWK